MQAVKSRSDLDPTVVTVDSDIIAYGQRKTVLVKSWALDSEEFRVFDFSKEDWSLVDEYPLYASYLKYGVDVFRVWAAVAGCDVTREESGLLGPGPQTLPHAFALTMKEEPPGCHNFPFGWFAKELRNSGRITLPLHEIRQHVKFVVQRYSCDGQYYDTNASILSFKDDSVVCPASEMLLERMTGRRDPKTRHKFTEQQKQCLDGYKPSDAIHKPAAAGLDTIAGLPEGRRPVKDCTGEEGYTETKLRRYMFSD